MTRCKWFLHQDRALEVRDLRVHTSLQIWIYENERPLGLHSIVPLAVASRGLAKGVDVLGRAMENAVRDVQEGRFALAHPDRVVAVAG